MLRLQSLRCTRLLLLVIGCAVLQACSRSSVSQLSGKYCLDGMDSDEAVIEFSCLYLKPDGTATITMIGALAEARWEFLEQSRIKIVGQSMGAGLTLDIAPDRSALIGLLGLVRYVRKQPSLPANQPMPLAPEVPQPNPPASSTVPLIAGVGFLGLVSLLLALVVLIRQQGEDDV